MLDLDKSGWETVRLGEVVRPSKEKCDPTDGSVERYVAGEHMDTDDLHIHRWGDVGDGYLGPAFHRRFHPGQVLYGSRRTYLRKVAVADFDGVCANTTFVLDAVPTLLSPRFLPFVMSSEPFHAFAVAESRGSVNPYVNWSDIARFEFSLPPLEEQERIADLLGVVERHSEALRSLICTLQTARDGCRAEVLRGLAPTTEVGPLWDMGESSPTTAIMDVAEVRAGATPLRGEHERYFADGNVPWVKTLDLNEGTITQTDENITQAAVDENSCKVRPAGTVLIAMYGGFNQIGRTGLLGVPAATNQAVAALEALDPGVRPRYLLEVLQAGRPWWRRVAASSRKDPNITKADIERFRFPLPPAAVQDDIIARLSQFDATIQDVVAEQDTCSALRRWMSELVFGEEG